MWEALSLPTPLLFMMFLHLLSLASHSHFTPSKLTFVTLYSRSISRRPTGRSSILHPGLFATQSALHPPDCQPPAVAAWALGLSFIIFFPSSSWVSFLRPYPSILLKCIDAPCLVLGPTPSTPLRCCSFSLSFSNITTLAPVINWDWMTSHTTLRGISWLETSEANSQVLIWHLCYLKLNTCNLFIFPQTKLTHPVLPLTDIGRNTN